jgi:hypothetical protein
MYAYLQTSRPVHSDYGRQTVKGGQSRAGRQEETVRGRQNSVSVPCLCRQGQAVTYEEASWPTVTMAGRQSGAGFGLATYNSELHRSRRLGLGLGSGLGTYEEVSWPTVAMAGTQPGRSDFEYLFASE